MGLTKEKPGKASDFKRDTSTSGASGGNTKGKQKGLMNFMTAMEQSGLTTKKKGTALGYTVKKKDVMPGMYNMFLKIPGVTPKDLPGGNPDWEIVPGGKDKGGPPSSGGKVTAAKTAGTPVNYGPGWISVTSLVGKKRA